ncbi:aspartate aminotransferase family protein [Egicoccus sp. AB-alg6-2]|uniref:aspartate aminotransferase family protein n=1 Tax=Egicoccus sp. AB-alg6-2 TaxID=3242692 RepID=UPI00359E3C5D
MSSKKSLAAQLHSDAVSFTPGGVHSNVRLERATAFFARGKGAWLWDVEGNDYVDYLLGQGPNFLGHAPEAVTEAVADACRRGMVYGAQHELEVEAGRSFLSAVAWADQVRFGLSGTEMVQAALRLARAVTGRKKFIRFEGHYHGWLDNVLLAPQADGTPGPASAGQLSSHLEDCVILPWNDENALAHALEEHAGQVAAVITEPFMCNSGAVSPRDGYLQRMRQLCDEHEAVLIFDEVITGFRVAFGGAAERFGVTPDLATYGKAMAGGWPVAALAGRAELMQRFADDVSHAGTFNASVMACAAVVATLEELRSDPPYARVEAHGEEVMAGIRKLADDHEVPLRVQGLGMSFHASFGPKDRVFDFQGLQALDLQRYNALAQRLTEFGVWVAGRGIWYVSAAHGDREATVVLERLDAALRAWHG